MIIRFMISSDSMDDGNLLRFCVPIFGTVRADSSMDDGNTRVFGNEL